MSDDGGAVIIPSIETILGDLYGVRITEEGLFHGAASSCRKRFALISRTTHAKEGEAILMEGSVPDTISVLANGEAELIAGPQECPLFRKPAVGHEIFGLPEAFGGCCFTYGLYALSDCEIHSIPFKDFDEFLRSEEIPRTRLIRILGLAVQMRQRLLRSI